MLKTVAARTLLYKHEQNHLTECGGVETIEDMKRLVQSIRDKEAAGGRGCLECKRIAMKLRLY